MRKSGRLAPSLPRRHGSASRALGKRSKAAGITPAAMVPILRRFRADARCGAYFSVMLLESAAYKTGTYT